MFILILFSFHFFPIYTVSLFLFNYKQTAKLT